MPVRFVILGYLLVLAVVGGPARGDFATPWVEGTKVGDVVTAHAWVVTMDAEQTSYGIFVMNDTMQPVLVQAQAEKEVVKPAVLGRWAMVKGKVTVRNANGTVRVQILEVSPISAAPAKTQP